MPWIFLCLMAINAVYFGWNFMEVSRPQSTVRAHSLPQLGARVELLAESRLGRAPVAEPLAGGDGAEAPDGSETAPPAAAPAAALPAAMQKQCFFVGPYDREGEARSFAGTLKAKRFVARTDKRKVEVKDYWVFLPPFVSRTKAEERLRELRAQGVQGFIVKEGVFVNAISLNHFSRPELAQSFLTQMKEKGIMGEYRELVSAGTEYWVYASPGQSQAEIKPALDEYIASRDSLKREITACDD